MTLLTDSDGASGSSAKPLPPVTVHFLGTCSGGGPITSRACSSLAVDFGNEIWLFDAADGTLGRLHQSPLRMANISRFFITHMHADHTLGLVQIITSVMSGIGVKEGEIESLKALGSRKKATTHIYGPKGIRKLVRTTLELTSVCLAGVFAVHELLSEGEEPSVLCGEEDLHANEAVGEDIVADKQGVWRNIMQEGNGRSGKGWAVGAGPIEHRVPSLGYVLQEPIPREPLNTSSLIPLLQSNAAALAKLDPPVKHPLSLLSHLTSIPPPAPYTLPSGDVIHPPSVSGMPPRKIVILGDCSGGTRNTSFQEMCQDASLLVHECTNASIPEAIQRGEKGWKVRAKDLAPSMVEKNSKSGNPPPGHKDNGKPQEKEKEKALADEGTNGLTKDEEAAQDEKKKSEVQKRAKGRGHSTPDEVGEFARKIRARRVIVNHFSAMFPSPRHTSSEPYPSLLAPLSPHPYPHPSSAASKVPSVPLTAQELHIRLIMQSLADQITAVLNLDDSKKVITVPSRDFMTIRIPAHELTPVELDVIDEYEKEKEDIMGKWKADGGLWVGDGKEKRWVGYTLPKSIDEDRTMS